MSRSQSASRGTSPPDAPVLQLDAVARRYGARTVLAPVTVRLAAGAVCLVSGGNGAGKTTLLRVAAGLLEPTSGSRRIIGTALYLRPGAGIRRRQRVLDAVAFAASLTAAPEPTAAARAALRACGLPEDTWAAEAARLSAGQRARVTLAVARAVAPAVVCLDEPLEHLDAPGRRAAGELIRGLAAGGSALLVAGSDIGEQLGPADAHVELVAGSTRVIG